MINNRQNGRRRGRGGGAPRPNGSGNAPDRGNRLDSRARGNAAQLHEKYKALARDAQMQGDRVNTEYYLQFADHYFRVLSESRARFEEQQQRPRRDDYQGANDYQAQGYEQGQGYDHDDYEDEPELNGNGGAAQAEARGGERQERFERPDRQDRGQRPDRGQQQGGRSGQIARDDRSEQSDDAVQPRRGRDRGAEANANRAGREELPFQPQAGDTRPAEEERAERPRRGRRSRAPEVETSEERIEMDRLPPAFGADAPLLAEMEEAAPAAEEKPRRRTRRPRSDAVTADV